MDTRAGVDAPRRVAIRVVAEMCQRCCCLDQYSEWALCCWVGGGGSEGVQLNAGEE